LTLAVVAAVACAGKDNDRASRERDAYKRAREHLCDALRGEMRLAATFAKVPADDPRAAQNYTFVKDALVGVVPMAEPCVAMPASVHDEVIPAILAGEEHREAVYRAAALAFDALDRASKEGWPLPHEYAPRQP
jgi:hypothetical protein